MRTSKSYWVSKNVLPFAKSLKFDYESYHKFFLSLVSTIQIYYSMMVNNLFSLLNGYEIMHQKPHSMQHSLCNIANLASNSRYIEKFFNILQVYNNVSRFILIFMTKQETQYNKRNYSNKQKCFLAEGFKTRQTKKRLIHLI